MDLKLNWIYLQNGWENIPDLIHLRISSKGISEVAAGGDESDSGLCKEDFVPQEISSLPPLQHKIQVLLVNSAANYKPIK